MPRVYLVWEDGPIQFVAEVASRRTRRSERTKRETHEREDVQIPGRGVAADARGRTADAGGRAARAGGRGEGGCVGGRVGASPPHHGGRGSAARRGVRDQGSSVKRQTSGTVPSG